MSIGKKIDTRELVESLKTEEGKRIAWLNLVLFGETQDVEYNRLAAPILEDKLRFLASGRAYSIAGQKDDAKRCYEKYVESKKHSLADSELIWVIKEKLGRPEEARTRMEESFELALKDPDISFYDVYPLYELAAISEEYDKAKELLETYIARKIKIARDDKDVTASFYRSCLESIAKTGDSDRIVAWAKEAIDKYPLDSEHTDIFQSVAANPEKYIEHLTSQRLGESYYDEDNGVNRNVDQGMKEIRKLADIVSPNKDDLLKEELDAEREGRFWSAATEAIGLKDEEQACNYALLGTLLGIDPLIEELYQGRMHLIMPPID